MSKHYNKKRKKILLVDDDSLFLCVMTRYLKDFDYDYIVAEEGQQAWEYLQQYMDEFFVVLSDRIMPKLHGLELLAKMKQAGFNIPLILVTGEASKEERCDALRQGVYDFFYKPICKELVLAVLKKIEG
jgi:DNA-binding NtrC family response regulator